MCCQYGTSGSGTIGGDCASIPGALKITTIAMAEAPGFPRICGRSKGLVTTSGGTVPTTVCCEFIL